MPGFAFRKNPFYLLFHFDVFALADAPRLLEFLYFISNHSRNDE